MLASSRDVGNGERAFVAGKLGPPFLLNSRERQRSANHVEAKAGRKSRTGNENCRHSVSEAAGQALLWAGSLLQLFVSKRGTISRLEPGSGATDVLKSWPRSSHTPLKRPITSSRPIACAGAPE